MDSREPILALGPLLVTPYSLLMFAGALVGVLLAARKKAVRPALPAVLLFAILFGHWFWSLFNMEDAESPLMQFLELWRGGYTLYGAVIGGFLAAWIYSRVLKLPLAEITDALAPGAAAALLFGRLAEYFSGAGYGIGVEPDKAKFFPLAYITYQEEDWVEWSYAVWFWEAVAALVILAVLLSLGRRARRGEVTAVFVTLLGTTQMLLEQFRRDEYVCTFNSFVRFSQVAALVSLVVLLVLLVVRHKPGKAQVILSFLTMTLAALTVVCAEFAFDKPRFDVWMRICVLASAVSFAALACAMRGRAGKLPGGLMILCGVLLALLHFLGEWNSDSLVLYAIMAYAVTAMGAVLSMNMGREHPEQPCL